MTIVKRLLGTKRLSRAQVRQQITRLASLRGVSDWSGHFTLHHTQGDAGRIAIETLWHNSDAPTFIFMPGTNAYALLYGEFLLAMYQRGYNVVAFDPRGHGQSDGARGSYDLSELIADYECVIDWVIDCGSTSIVAGGSSQGGITAFYVAASRTDLQAAVCHNLADAMDKNVTQVTKYPRLSNWLRPMLPQLVKWFPELPIPLPLYVNVSDEKVRGIGTAQALIASDALICPFVRLRTLESLCHTPMTRAPENMTTPVLVIHAGRDTIFPRDYVASVYERIGTDKKFIEYAHAYHYVIADQADDIAADIDAWLRRKGQRHAA